MSGWRARSPASPPPAMLRKATTSVFASHGLRIKLPGPRRAVEPYGETAMGDGQASTGEEGVEGQSVHRVYSRAERQLEG